MYTVELTSAYSMELRHTKNCIHNVVLQFIYEVVTS